MYQFCEALAKRASNNGHVVDLFVGCLDQVGLLEMKSLPNSTNGVIVLSDSFATSIFKQSFLRMFNKDEQGNLQMGFNATFDVQVNNIMSDASMSSPLPRRPKNSKYQVLLVMPFRLGRSPDVLVKPRLASVKRPHGRSTPSLRIPRPLSTSKS